MEGKTPVLTDSLKNRFFTLAATVEGRRWKSHFAYIGIIFRADTNNT
jgi:hypothetical protein